MNDRIRQLAEQAGLRFTQLMSNPMVPVVDGRETDLEKFAQLIVAECIALAVTEEERYDSLDGRDCDYCSMAMTNFQVVLAKHFGAEE